MDIWQWIVVRPDGSITMAWAPSHQTQIPQAAPGSHVGQDLLWHRRGLPLTLPSLPYPVVVAGPPESSSRDAIPSADKVPERGCLRLSFEEGGQGDAHLPSTSDAPMVFASVFAEYISCVVGALEQLSLPVICLRADSSQPWFDVDFKVPQQLSLSQLCDSLILLKVAALQMAIARGFRITRCSLLVTEGEFPVDGSISAALATCVRRASGGRP